ncbi:adenine nucleotide translocase lysine N-methyltransferase isoform X2 [Tympanuchus pallidicinctus]|uniref:adenine nucleotide translocase lysine N-methyltransferase isoform X2 n=1 Tax=Tympanuchus pallidicinctus TaxID=109042 RepID=UPI0022871700|nr:adenine nucleotide translocase lysine N-methyltransferase isoform X2 [Tympanuchus pallidicinctus]
MDAEALDELAGQLQGEALGGRGLLQLAATTGLAAYAVWAAVLMPGFRRVPLHLQVPYVPSSAQQVANVMGLLRGRTGKTADLGSGDGRLVVEAYKQGLRPAVGYELNPWLLWLARYRARKAGYEGKVSFLKQDLWKANLSDCYNVIVFLAPSVILLEWQGKHGERRELREMSMKVLSPTLPGRTKHFGSGTTWNEAAEAARRPTCSEKEAW